MHNSPSVADYRDTSPAYGGGEGLRSSNRAKNAMAKNVDDEYLRRIPKCELHCHLSGTLRATTVADLARRYGIELPRPAETLYQWPDFYGFLDVLRLTSQVLRTSNAPCRTKVRPSKTMSMRCPLRRRPPTALS